MLVGNPLPLFCHVVDGFLSGGGFTGHIARDLDLDYLTILFRAGQDEFRVTLSHVGHLGVQVLSTTRDLLAYLGVVEDGLPNHVGIAGQIQVCSLELLGAGQPLGNQVDGLRRLFGVSVDDNRVAGDGHRQLVQFPVQHITRRYRVANLAHYLRLLGVHDVLGRGRPGIQHSCLSLGEGRNRLHVAKAEHVGRHPLIHLLQILQGLHSLRAIDAWLHAFGEVATAQPG